MPEKKSEETLLFGGEVESMEKASDCTELPTEIKELINVRWPQVSVVTNALLASTRLEQFYFSEKTDGLHRNLLIYEKRIYDITHFDDVQCLGDADYDKTLILDCEEYNDKYFIFDVYYADGRVLNEETFLNRMSYCRSFIDALGEKFVVKEFKPIPNLKFLLDYIKNDVSPDTGNEIDGVILQRIDMPYLSKKNETVFKLKPLSLLTVDFYLKYDAKDSSYSLYSIGSYFQFLNSLTTKPRMQRFIYDDKGNEYERKRLKSLPESMLILFDSPFYPNLSTYRVDKTWNTCGYFKRIRDAADAMIRDMDMHPSKYDKSIVEMSLTLDKKWVPIRLRADKRKPNGFAIAQSVVGCIFDYIKDEPIYFQKDLSADSSMQTLVHEINHVFRKYIIEQHLVTTKHASIIDLCGGRGGDEFNLYANGYTDFFAIDGDTTALKQYVDRSYGLRNKLKHNKYTPFKYPWKSGTPENGLSFTVNALHHILGKDYKPIIADLQSRADYRGNVDAVLMNYAIHYLCSSSVNIKALAAFVDTVLDRNGKFVITYFDGDEILKRVKDGEAKVGPFTIKILKSTKTSTIAMMPLITIQNDGYREEPLVHSTILKPLETKLRLVDEYNAYDRTREYVDALNPSKGLLVIRDAPSLYSSLIEYYKLIKVRVYEK